MSFSGQAPWRDAKQSGKPGVYSGSGNPDRMDALVWALTELMISADGSGIIELYRREVEATTQRAGWPLVEEQARAASRRQRVCPPSICAPTSPCPSLMIE
jgi:hypothetical protein